MKKVIYFFLGLFIMASCGSEESLMVVNGDYFPTTEGSVWTYNGVSNFSVEMTGNEVSFSGITFREINTTLNGQAASGYVRKEGGDYVLRGVLPGIPTDANLTVLKANEEVGSTWSEELSVNGFDTEFRFTIEEIGTSEVVIGKLFKNVIKVRMDAFIDIDFLGSANLAESQDIYFAENVGIIRIDQGVFGRSDIREFDVAAE
ncbi:MAG: hypothetical protein AAFX87_25680 [Bacteroidota bacterium]